MSVVEWPLPREELHHREWTVIETFAAVASGGQPPLVHVWAPFGMVISALRTSGRLGVLVVFRGRRSDGTPGELIAVNPRAVVTVAPAFQGTGR